MSLKIIAGKLCCIVALVPCAGGTTLYSTSNHATVGTVVLYSGACYTVTATTSCGTIITGPFTAESGCSASACTPACPPCSALSSSYSVSGWAGTLPDCCWASVGVNCGDPHVDCVRCYGYSTWDGGMTPTTVGGVCYFNADWASGLAYATTSVGGFVLCLYQKANIECTGSAGGGNYLWRLSIPYSGDPAGIPYGWIGYYTGPTPAGTYNVDLADSTSPCAGTDVLPPTMTVA